MASDHGPFPGAEDFQDEPQVWAGGGVIIQDGHVLLVHRPRYDDWTFPKGKLDPGETLAECALREVLEETGLACSIEQPLVANRYQDGKGRLKEVRYWLMALNRDQFEPNDFEPNDEVDQVMWADATEADRVLTYPRDTEVLDAALPHLL